MTASCWLWAQFPLQDPVQCNLKTILLLTGLTRLFPRMRRLGLKCGHFQATHFPQPHGSTPRGAIVGDRLFFTCCTNLYCQSSDTAAEQPLFVTLILSPGWQVVFNFAFRLLLGTDFCLFEACWILPPNNNFLPHPTCGFCCQAVQFFPIWFDGNRAL